MNVGLFDLPAPLFVMLDEAFRYIDVPAVVRVAACACACAWISMRLYRHFSDQERLAGLRAEVIRTQRALALHDGDFRELQPLILDNLRLSLRQLGLTLRPALLASLPLLFVLPWLSNRFEFERPAQGTQVAVCVQPDAAATSLHWASATATAGRPGCWQLAWPGSDATATLSDERGASLYALPTNPRSNIVHKFTMLNWLIANPDGYLPATTPIERIAIDLPTCEMIGFGPQWSRDWETWFFGTLLLASLALKLRWRLH